MSDYKKLIAKQMEDCISYYVDSVIYKLVGIKASFRRLAMVDDNYEFNSYESNKDRIELTFVDDKVLKYKTVNISSTDKARYKIVLDLIEDYEEIRAEHKKRLKIYEVLNNIFRIAHNLGHKELRETLNNINKQ